MLTENTQKRDENAQNTLSVTQSLNRTTVAAASSAHAHNDKSTVAVYCGQSTGQQSSQLFVGSCKACAVYCGQSNQRKRVDIDRLEAAGEGGIEGGRATWNQVGRVTQSKAGASPRRRQ